MTARPIPAWLVSAVIGGLLSGAVTLAVKNGELSALRETHAQEREQAQKRAAKTLAQAQARGDTLTYDLHAQVSANAALQAQIDDHLDALTHGRACLDAAALRVLDRAAQPAAVPAPARSPVAARATQPAADPPQPASAGHEPGATDTDVARWANDAYHRYADCAARLDALIRWHRDPAAQEPTP